MEIHGSFFNAEWNEPGKDGRINGITHRPEPQISIGPLERLAGGNRVKV
jgi:hypothetical protein